MSENSHDDNGPIMWWDISQIPGHVRRLPSHYHGLQWTEAKTQDFTTSASAMRPDFYTCISWLQEPETNHIDSARLTAAKIVNILESQEGLNADTCRVFDMSGMGEFTIEMCRKNLYNSTFKIPVTAVAAPPEAHRRIRAAYNKLECWLPPPQIYDTSDLFTKSDAVHEKKAEKRAYMIKFIDTHVLDADMKDSEVQTVWQKLPQGSVGVFAYIPRLAFTPGPATGDPDRDFCLMGLENRYLLTRVGRAFDIPVKMLRETRVDCVTLVVASRAQKSPFNLIVQGTSPSAYEKRMRKALSHLQSADYYLDQAGLGRSIDTLTNRFLCRVQAMCSRCGIGLATPATVVIAHKP